MRGAELPRRPRLGIRALRYQARAGERSACGDIVGPLEEHFQLMQGVLGFSWPAGRQVTYYKFADAGDLSDNSECGDAAACTNGSAVQTALSFNGHELIHAYLAPTGFPPWLILEGVAVALSCQLELYEQPNGDWRDVYPLPNSGPRSSELYGAGGWLTGFLLRSRPIESFMLLYGRATQAMTADAFASLFEEIYGESLDYVWAQVTALARPPIICPWECTRPSFQADGVTSVPSATVCGIGAGHTLELLDSRDLVVSLTGSSSFRIGSCGTGSLAPATFWSGNGIAGVGAYRLSAGKYFFGGPAMGDTMTLAAFPAETWITSTCAAQAQAPPWADLRGSLYLALPDGVWNVPLSWSEPRLVVVYPPFTSTTAAASVCPACDSAQAQCSAATQDSPFAATVSGSRFLRVTSSPTPGGSEFAEVSVLAQ
jgi:hypothetical protein